MSNVASVNYYFSGKEELYCEVFRFLSEQLGGRQLPERWEIHSQEELEAALRSWVGNFIAAISNPDRFVRWLARLSCHELTECGTVEHELFLRHIQPTLESLRGLLRYGMPDTEPAMSCKLFSIFGSCLFYFKNPLTIRLYSGDENYLRNHAGAIVQEIVASQLGTLRYQPELTKKINGE